MGTVTDPENTNIRLCPIGELALLRLLQLSSSALPVGAYSYSEGLEHLVQIGVITDRFSLNHWLSQELRYGAVRLEAAAMLRAHRAARLGDEAALSYWNAWLSALRETEELREQSSQMGRALARLLQDLDWDVAAPPGQSLATLGAACGEPCNFAIMFGLAAAVWEIGEQAAILGYLQSWVSNLVSAGVRLVPLGQTIGQQILMDTQPVLLEAAAQILSLADDNLESCGWGLAIASMQHETQYSRLFRS
ncbi:urease accessory protein UreF [Leptolyngbya sp. 'hensonii']|uniref:urease accessory protein UreF n=1 Tax=Leptolyngbya sp. 'hensonii' TaxID=1922337 RepID=UPI00094FBA01|nr:urease accessory protein UreF [Leptolyngbya sp. 'hensonii']OLP15718.1 urease accessory protein UreF [Leptolyngbya sp. 'hensonii']